MYAGQGLREMKKRRTRELIAATALDLFADHGFDHVTVADVAAQAEVATATVYNYFPTKEDLVLRGLDAFESAMLEALRHREAGESVVSAFCQFVTRPESGMINQDEPARRRLAATAQVIESSDALKRRERDIFDGFTTSLAELIAAETGQVSDDDSAEGPDDPRPWVVANALIGVHRSLVSYVRGELLAGRYGAGVVRGVHTRSAAAFDLLERGLAEYAPAAGAK